MRTLRVIGGLLDLIVPPACAACGLPGAVICAACRDAIGWPSVVGCRRCGHPWAVSTSSCAECPASVDSLVFAAAYADPMPALMSAFKDRGRRQLAGEFAALIAARCARPPEGAVLAPVPIGRERRRERGFDQAALIAAQLGALWDRPVAAILTRTRDDPPQRGASATERAANVRGAFAVRHRETANEVWIVDDVCTTGATVTACARVLRRDGVRRVRAVCVARVLRHL